MVQTAENPVLEVERLRYRFPGGQLALDDVTFSLAAGERLAIVGPSGAGKSTLLLHLNGLLPERLDRHSAGESGVVRVDGQAITPQTAVQVRRSVGLLFQDPDDQLFCPTVGEDVAFGPLNLGLSKDEVRRRIVESLSAVGLEGFDTRSTVQLSVGERKRVCLAGVLACRPSVLALDEPSSNLDPGARRQLMRILAEFAGSQIIATHDLDLAAELCDRVVVLDAGRVRAVGPAGELLADEFLMERHGLEVPPCIRYGFSHRSNGAPSASASAARWPSLPANT